jgi:hypothetical protein
MNQGATNKSPYIAECDTITRPTVDLPEIVAHESDNPYMRLYALTSRICQLVTGRLQQTEDARFQANREIADRAHTLRQYFINVFRPVGHALSPEYDKFPANAKAVVATTLNHYTLYENSENFLNAGIKTARDIFTLIAEVIFELCPDDSPEELTRTFFNSYPLIFTLAKTEPTDFISEFQLQFSGTNPKLDPLDFFYITETGDKKLLQFNRAKFLQSLQDKHPSAYEGIMSRIPILIGCPATRTVNNIRSAAASVFKRGSKTNLIDEVVHLSLPGLPIIYAKLKKQKERQTKPTNT